MENLIYVLEIVFSILGIYLIFIQNPKTIQNSFVASSLETFNIKSVKGNYKFLGTIFVILVVILLIAIDIKIH